MSPLPARLNPPPSSAYLQWYRKRLPQARFSLGTSFIHQITPSEWGVSIRDLALHAEPETLLKQVARHYGVPPGHIVPTVGTSEANLRLFDLLLRPGDHVLLEQPTYEPLWRALTHRRVRLGRVPRRMEDGFALDLAALKRVVTPRTRLIVLTSPHNPSGVAIPRETLREVGRIARRVGAYVHCDEVFSDFQQPGTWQPAATLGPQFVSTNSFSKCSGLYGLRIGWALCAAPLAAAANRITETSTPPWSEPSIVLAVKAFRDFSWIRERAARTIAAHWPAMTSWLETHPEFECVTPTAGVICFIRHKRRFNDRAFADHLLKRHQTIVTPGSFFELPGGVRVGFGAPSAQFTAALSRLSKGLETFARKSGSD